MINLRFRCLYIGGRSLRSYLVSLTPADRKVFYRYARGSSEENNARLCKRIRRKIVPDKNRDKHTVITQVLGPKLNAFIRSTK
jgi:hypothetical protein